jgi:aspartate racemase
MKTIGLIGGTTWFSTIDYYRVINEGVQRRLGGHNSARLLLYSVNFLEFLPADNTDWAGNGRKMGAIARHLQDAGADCLLLCANTMHMMADTIKGQIDIPFIHIVDETAKVILQTQLASVGLLGTRFTMQQPFFRERLEELGVKAVTPTPADQEYLHRIIFEELNKGLFAATTKMRVTGIIHDLVDKGAQGIILGCTEFPQLIKPEDSPVPLFDTVAIHANAAVEFALMSGS